MASSLKVAPLAVLSVLVACGGSVSTGLPNASAVGGGGSATSGLQDVDRPLIPASKVDVLLVVDNSASMGDKSARLADSIGTLLRDVALVGDVHVGVVSTSLGNLGGDVCSVVNPETNGRAHLRSTGPNGAPVAGVQNGVLALTALGGGVDAFVSAAQELVRGVGETGCGLEAQLESAYRFLVQPDPWDVVRIDANMLADLGDGVDGELLAQRKAFLRPDSALVVLMLTDEDDSIADPLAVGGQGWAFMSRNFPGSNVRRTNPAEGTTAPRPTSICATNPASEDCTSCGFATLCDPATPKCQKIKQDPSCKISGVAGLSGAGYDGYLGPDDDELNVRFHRMKERYGIDPQYPISRYVDGFGKSVVPDRKAEHLVTTSAGRRTIADYSGAPNCTNPIFAETLPSGPGEELCNLPRGSRSRELVVFALLGGVPEQLASGDPSWAKIVGANPDGYDYAGIDPHMIPSTLPRPGLSGASLPLGNNGSDPVDGREWNTQKRDLELACTFPLSAPKECQTGSPSCDCAPDQELNPPLCASPGKQNRAKAYPTTRPLRVVRGLGDRGVVGSICSPSYDGAMQSISAKLASRVAR
jgi:hypothetical protein